MRKIVIMFIVATLFSATASAPAFANGWGGPYYERGLPGGPLWPIVAALSIPAAVIDTVVHVALPFPGVGYPAIPVTAGPAVYAGPAAYYPPRVYVAPRGYYSPRAYYPARYYRTYRSGW
jgi:hypothetical protein